MVGAPRAGPGLQSRAGSQGHQAQACSGRGERASHTQPTRPALALHPPRAHTHLLRYQGSPQVRQPASLPQSGALRCRHQDPRPLNNPAPPPQLRPLGLSGT